MANRFYPADQTDLVLNGAQQAMAGILGAMEKVQQEYNLLKQASQGKVTLEKAAASDAKIKEFVSRLVDRSIITEDMQEKFAAACKESPDNILDIAMQAIKLSEAPGSLGQGIKSAKAGASDRSAEMRAWNRIIELGAN